MDILEKILKWSENLPHWQRDATRRLFQQDGRLSERIFNEIAEKVLPIIKQYRKDVQQKTLEIGVKNGSEDANFGRAFKEILTQADIDVQKEIIRIIKAHDDNASIIAEEESNCTYNPQKQVTWVIDPIDGTVQFVNSESREFCVVVCQLLNGVPTNAMVLLPEIGIGISPVLVIGLLEEKKILVNGKQIESLPQSNTLKSMSATRKPGWEPYVFEEQLRRLGCDIKTTTTSQSIDMLRTAIDLTLFTDLPLNKLDLFYRKQQKIWDGAAGMCLNLIADRIVCTSDRKELLPLNETFLMSSPPINETVIVACEQVLLLHPEIF